MKNCSIEAMKQRAKLYHDMTPETLTFWDDAAFIVKDYRVGLWWVHPRHQYHDLVETEARRRIGHLRPESDLFADKTPNYKKLGRSRKKIVSWTHRPTTDEYRRYFDLLSDMERQVAQEVAFEVLPSMKIAWYSWCKGLNLCVPYEVRSEADLIELSHITRRLVRRQSTLAEEFGDYVYRQGDWLADCKTIEAQNPRSLRAHALA